MKTNSCPLLLLLINGILVCILSTQAVSRTTNPRVAVMPVTTSFYTADSSLSTTVEAEVEKEIAKLRPQWKLVDRTSLQSAIQELNLQHSGLMDPQTQSRLGKLVGAQLIIIANVDSVTTKEMQILFSQQRNMDQVVVHVSLKLENVQTGDEISNSTGTGTRLYPEGDTAHWQGASTDSTDRAVEALLPNSNYKGQWISSTEIAIPAGRKDRIVSSDSFKVYEILGTIKVGGRNLVRRNLLGTASIEDLQKSATVLKISQGFESPASMKDPIEVILGGY